MNQTGPTLAAATPGLQAVLASPAVQTIFDLLNDAEDSVRLVGGVVRNSLMHRPVSDIDMATTHLPETVMERAVQAGLKAIPTGLPHGTVTLVIDHRSFEITTLRQDIDTHGRHATVRFGRDFNADAQRRDFTINALYADAQGRLYDYTGGLDDIARKQVRFIGEPSVRITEDYLRIMRFFRFFSDYAEGPIDPAGFLACISHRHQLNQLSRERVGSELLKILTSVRVAETLNLMQQGDLLGQIMPVATVPDAVAALVRLAPEACAMTRLMALAQPDQQAVGRLREALRLSNQQTTLLERILKALALIGDSTTPAHVANGLSHAVFRCGREAGLAAAMLVCARIDAPREALDQMRTKTLAITAVSPFSGQDLLARGVPAGPQIGAIMAEAERLWIEQGFSTDASEQDRLLDLAVKHILH